MELRLACWVLMFGGVLACGAGQPDTLEDISSQAQPEARAPRRQVALSEDIFYATCPRASQAQGATLSVSNSGPWNPSKPLGSNENPYSTIMAAVRAARPGNIILVRGGDYNEQVSITAPKGARAGTATAPIVLRGEMAGRPRILPSGTNVGALLDVKLPYWVVEFLEIAVQGRPSYAALFETNTQCSQLHDSVLYGGRAGAGITASYANFVMLSHNQIFDFSKTNTDSHGVAIRGVTRDIFIVDNDIHDVSGDGVQCQPNGGRPSTILIERNQLHATGENGIDVKACDDLLIYKNLIYSFPNIGRFPWQANTSAAEAVLVHEDATNIQILGNDISQAGRGVAIGGNNAIDLPTNVLVEDNFIHDIYNYANRGNGQGVRVVTGRGIHIIGNTLERTADAGLRLAADEPNSVMGLIVYDNVLRNMRLFVRLGRKENRPGMGMDSNRYEGPIGAFTISGGLSAGTHAQWLAALAPEFLDQHSLRIPAPTLLTEEEPPPPAP
ncbi:right-handed parallel beta-helix repeat-containing protein [Myxococcus landrumensis]|uniref:Right-handed parallel beta-helix repeat-containing protein n=1 Tax=Myxococcus landrumensis TaxID=2813577 RepID=A0ABX7N1A7_9BACT|nr:right-handed parallel beta-helix repeat-containing protein [Myxococcus landrumus]QSQ12495.1 right-handed parallel beta-helix repeat-containing protein [Myxococcus landrumus]